MRARNRPGVQQTICIPWKQVPSIIVPRVRVPAITGPDLAEAFGARLGRDVVFDQITAEEFRTSMAPLIGESAAADIAGPTRR